jgi:hypothetical protein
MTSNGTSAGTRSAIGITHIPADLVVDRWASDAAGSSNFDFLFLHDSWPTFGRSIGRKINQQYQCLGILPLNLGESAKFGGMWGFWVGSGHAFA